MPRCSSPYCSVCSADLSSPTPAKRARSCRDRPCRRAHARGALRWRRARNAKRQAAARRAERTAHASTSRRARAFVLCPLRREMQHGLFSAMRAPLVGAGLAPSCARRLQGVDLARARPLDRARPASAVVLRAALRGFATMAHALFAADLKLRYVFLSRTTAAVTLASACGRSPRSRGRLGAEWLGWGTACAAASQRSARIL